MIHLYGFAANSPFTQRVMMLMHIFKIDYELQTFPSYKMFLKNGFIVPMLEDNGDVGGRSPPRRAPLGDVDVVIDSANIIRHLKNKHPDKFSDPSFFAFDEECYNHLEKMFASHIFVKRKLSNGFWWCNRFLDSIDFIKNKTSLVDIATTPTTAIYMYSAHQFTRLFYDFIKEDELNTILRYFDNILSQNKYILNKDISIMDITFYGQFQSMMSKTSDETLPIIFKYNNLLRWFDTMNCHLETYPHLFSKMKTHTFSKLISLPISERINTFKVDRVVFHLKMSPKQIVAYTISLLLHILLYPIISIAYWIAFSKRKSANISYAETKSYWS